MQGRTEVGATDKKESPGAQETTEDGQDRSSEPGGAPEPGSVFTQLKTWDCFGSECPRDVFPFLILSSSRLWLPGGLKTLRTLQEGFMLFSGTGGICCHPQGARANRLSGVEPVGPARKASRCISFIGEHKENPKGDLWLPKSHITCLKACMR